MTAKVQECIVTAGTRNLSRKQERKSVFVMKTYSYEKLHDDYYSYEKLHENYYDGQGH